MYFLKWGEGVKILVSHQNPHQKATLMEKELSSHVDRMPHSVDSQPLSSVILVITEWTIEQSDKGGRMGDVCRLYNMDVHSPRLTRL